MRCGHLTKIPLCKSTMARSHGGDLDSLDEEREQRWWAAERRSEPPPAHLQLERAYKSQVKDLKARLELSEAQRREAEARVELQGCLLLQEQLAHARLRDRPCGDVV